MTFLIKYLKIMKNYMYAKEVDKCIKINGILDHKSTRMEQSIY